MPSHECTNSADDEGAASIVTEAEIKMQQIDATIRKRTDEILALKVQRNNYAPISSLPVEIMTNIFLVVKKLMEDATNVQSSYSRHRRLDWIRVSHVSTTWRNIALDFVGLWIEPPFWNKPWAEEMLRRSKGAALTIRCDFSVESTLKSRQFLQEAMKSGEKINELQLLCVSEDYVGIIPTRLSRATNIHLSGHCLHSPLPAAILSEASKLRGLSLRSCKIDWVSCLPHSITTLRLQEVNTPSTLTVAQFLDALENLSLLEVLDLHYAMGYFETSHSPSRTINLPKLRKLSILSSMEHAAMFFRHVAFPPNMLSLSVQARETVNSSSPNFGVNAIDMITAIGRIYAEDASNIDFRAISLGRSGMDSFHFFVDDAHFLPSLAPFSLTIFAPSRPLSSSFSTKILTKLLTSGLPVKNVATVHLDNAIPYSAEELTQTLGRLPNLSRIKLNNLMLAEALLEAIQIAADMEELYFSNLSVLELEGLEFDPDHNGDNVFFDKLRDCLMCRCEYDAEITKLVLEDCSQLDDYMVEQLEQIVVDVEWDEAEQGFTEDEESDLYGMEEGYGDMYFDYDDSDDDYYYGGMYF